MLDIIIVNYKSTPQLVQCLDSIEGCLGHLAPRIYVADNSGDSSVDPIRSQFPRVVVHQNTRNIGFAAAVNQALRKSQSPYVMLLNPDSQVLTDFVTPALDLMNADPTIGALGPRIYDHDGRTIQESARTFPNMLTGLFGRTSFLSKRFPRNRFTRANLLSAHSTSGKPLWVDWISGACMLVRRRVYDQIGGMDEAFFMYWEDADWCRRMWRSGWKVIYFPTPGVKHAVGGSSDHVRVRAAVAFHRSVFRLYCKYNPRMIWWSPLVLTLLSGRLVLLLASQHILRANSRRPMSIKES